tara:strand:+ start:89 stop:340 length:252 start_codon:yes stop_codon:yes gene_type:complete
MKNIILIDLDSDRDEVIKITKPENMVESISDEVGAKKMILEDITTVCQALGTLIKVGEDSKYFDGKKSAQLCIDFLNENFIKK